jgi:protein-disulfide isomerase
MTEIPPTPTPRTAVRSSLAAVGLAVALAALALAFTGGRRLTAEVAELRDSVRLLASEVANLSQSAMIDVAGAPALGPADAIVTLIEFSDYECPFCLQHFQNTMPRLLADYIQTGKIRYVFRDFPIDQLHPEAIRAHEAAQCAGEQGRFWDMHNRLFTGPGTHSDEALNARATEAGVDLTTLQACLESGRMTAVVRAISADAIGLGATGTPAFFLGFRDPATDQVRIVRAVTGAQPYEVFQQVLDALLQDLN